jgi:hypothetical protein
MWIMSDFSNTDANKQQEDQSPSKYEVDGLLF